VSCKTSSPSLILWWFLFIQKLSFQTANFFTKNYQYPLSKRVNIFISPVEIHGSVDAERIAEIGVENLK
jgi:hypothetical protein